MAAQVSAHNCTLGSISLGYISFATLALLASQKTIKPPLFGSKYLYNSPLLASNLVSSLEKDPHSDGCIVGIVFEVSCVSWKHAAVPVAAAWSE